MKRQDTDIAVFQEDAPGAAASAPAVAPGEIIIGSLTGIDAQGQPLVNYPENPTNRSIVAMSTLGITAAHVGRNIALLFANGDAQRPVIMGLIHSPLHDLIMSYDANPQEQSTNEQSAPPAIKVDDVTVDGKRIVLEAKEEIVIKCGEASITLTKAGKILIRGNYLLNRSSGVNRILGGSVQVN